MQVIPATIDVHIGIAGWSTYRIIDKISYGYIKYPSWGGWSYCTNVCLDAPGMLQQVLVQRDIPPVYIGTDGERLLRYVNSILTCDAYIVSPILANN